MTVENVKFLKKFMLILLTLTNNFEIINENWADYSVRIIY